jgi:hypothetical protein
MTHDQDAPRGHRDPAEVARKLSLLDAPHVAPLSAFVKRLQQLHGEAAVPWFDPTEAGVNAPILLLLEAPGPRSTTQRGGSGFISPDNNDMTAQNMWTLLREAKIDRATDVVTWNVVPWYLGTDTKLRNASATDLAEARSALVDLLGLLPHLRVVVLIGKPARLGWERIAADLPTTLPTLHCPHASPTNINTRPEARPEILAALVEARRMAYAA